MRVESVGDLRRCRVSAVLRPKLSYAKVLLTVVPSVPVTVIWWTLRCAPVSYVRLLTRECVAALFTYSVWVLDVPSLFQQKDSSLTFATPESADMVTVSGLPVA